MDVTEEATRRLNAIQDDIPAFNELIAMARASALAGEDAVEMKMSKNALRKGHSGTTRDDETELQGPNVRDWFEQPHYMWNHDDKLLLCGAIICDELRSEVLKQINYSCSGGVAHNKMLSKIASAMHKPNRQTLVPSCAVQNLMHCLPINRVAGFGGKLGDSLSDFGGRKLEKFSDLIEVGKSELSASFGEETTIWMLNAAAGIDHTPVEQRALTASIGCGKSYRQKNTLPPIALQDGRVLHWLRELSEELEERVQMDTDMHSRKPKQITVGLSIAYVIPPKPAGETADPVKKWHEGQGMSLSKVGPMCAGAVAISKAAHAMAVRAVADSTRLNKPWNITYISLSASGFVPIANESRSISSFFKSAPSPLKKSNPSSPYDKNTAMLLKEIKEKEEQNEREEKEIQLEIEKKRLSTINSTPTSSSSSSSSLSDIPAVVLFPKEHSSNSIDRNPDNIKLDFNNLKSVNSATETVIESDTVINTHVPHEVKNIPQDFYCGNDDDCEEYDNDEISDSIKEISSYYTDKRIVNKRENENTKNENTKNANSESVDDEANDVDKNVKKVKDDTYNHIDDTIRSSNDHNQIKKNNDNNDNTDNNENKKEIKNSKIIQDKSIEEISEKTKGKILSESSKVISSILTDDGSNRGDDLSRGRTVCSNGISSCSFHNDLLQENKCSEERDDSDGDGDDDVIIMEDNIGENSHEYNDLYDYNDHNNDSNDSNASYANIDNNARQIIGSNDDVINNDNNNHNDNNDANNETDSINNKDYDNNINDNDNDSSHDDHNNNNTKINNNNSNNSNNNIDNNNTNNNNNNSLKNSTTVSQIDMEVFYSLPLDLQEELSASMNIPNFSNFQDSKNINKVSVPKGTKNKINLNSKKNISAANIPKTGSQLSTYFNSSISNSSSSTSKCNSDNCSNVIMIEDDDSGNENENKDADNDNDDIDILSSSKR